MTEISDLLQFPIVLVGFVFMIVMYYLFYNLFRWLDKRRHERNDVL